VDPVIPIDPEPIPPPKNETTNSTAIEQQNSSTDEDGESLK
jgi:hypothetical protein